MSEAELKADPAYHDGFFDAQSGEPLFPGASAPYEAGWRAYRRASEILTSNGFSRQAGGHTGTTGGCALIGVVAASNKDSGQ